MERNGAVVTVGVCIGTFGDLHDWLPLVRRASLSVTNQTHPADCISWIHGDTLQEARNVAAAKADTCDWLIFLDADDELDPGYIEAMLGVADGTVDIIQPSTLGVHADGHEDDAPVLIPEKDLSKANYLVIGSMCRASMFFNVGGFGKWPVLEDWECWQRMVLSGARVSCAPDAVYRVHVREHSRNTDQELHDRTYREIRVLHAEAWGRRQP